MYEFKNDLTIILKTLNISIHELANELSFDVPTISNWLNGKYDPDLRSKEDIYEYAYKNKVYINLAYEYGFKELSATEGFIPLYHGSKAGIVGDIDFKYSKEDNDFGKGFYCGETIEQSAMFVCDYKKSCIYSFGLFAKKLKKYEYHIDNEWMLTIAYYRGLLEEYKSSKKLMKIIEKSKDVDYLIAPIANNRMYDIIGEFVNGNITDIACSYALAALDLGKQYVLKTNKAINSLGLFKEYYLCNSEKDYYKQTKIESQKNRYDKIKNFRSKHREGKYIEELL